MSGHERPPRRGHYGGGSALAPPGTLCVVLDSDELSPKFCFSYDITVRAARYRQFQYGAVDCAPEWKRRTDNLDLIPRLVAAHPLAAARDPRARITSHCSLTARAWDDRESD
ncbi:hypothetical protein EVAR_85438_1 [Eumeta japonica]|uniref:Uncharacterized protein n=1 Tax=Eumeta variegata TaxID=151549 RepID=A0A4C1WIF3_EUMVA|nr:hypothetical protein EVAR_85438_1 [Eumeta japonica]